jgi:hypothetical protein
MKTRAGGPLAHVEQTVEEVRDDSLPDVALDSGADRVIETRFTIRHSL